MLPSNSGRELHSPFNRNNLAKVWPYVLFLLIFSFILYGNTIPNEYAIDDSIVADNELTQQGIKAIPEIFTSRYRVIGQYNYGYRPIVKSAFALEYELFGRNPHIGHFINILIYAVTGIFLFLLLSKLLKGYHRLFPFIVTVLFMAHPVHTEVVASLKNREELLSFFGCIVSLFFFIKYAENRRLLHMLYGLFFYMFAFLSKQNAIAFAVVIPLTVYFFTDTSFHLIFFKKGLEIISSIAQRAKRFMNQKYTILLTGLLCYYAIIVVWHYNFYLYAVLLFIPAAFLSTRYYIVANPSQKPCVESLLKNKGFWVMITLFFLTVVVKHSIYVYMPFIRGPYVVVVILCFLFTSWYLYKNFAPLMGAKNAQTKFYITVIGLYCYSFPQFNDDMVLSVIAGLIPPLLYFYPAVLAKKTAGLSASNGPAMSHGKINWRDFFGSISGSARLFLLLAVALGIASYAFVVVPSEYLPPEQRELYYFENPLFYMNEWWLNIATGLYSLLIYIRLLVFPHPLVFYYGFNHVPIVDFSNGLVILSLLLHLILFIYAIAKFKQKHILSFAILYYLSTIFMFSNLVLKIPGIVGERLVYMSSLGFCVAVAYIIFKILKIQLKVNVLSKKSRLKLLLASSLLVIPYSIKTIARNQDWKNHSTLYLHDIPYLKNSLHANSLVASQMLREINPYPESQAEVDQNQRKLQLVVKHFKQVLVLDPKEVKTMNNLGRVYFEFYQDYGKALEYFEKAIEIEPATAEAILNIGRCYENLDMLQSAKSAYKKALVIDENQVESVSSLANLYFKMGIKDSALFLNDHLVEIDSTLDLPYINVGNYYLQLGNEPKAVELFEKAVGLNPENAELCNDLSNYFRELGNQRKAIYYARLSTAN